MNSIQPYNIICCIDHNYIVQCTVLMVYYLRTNQHTAHFHIIHDDLSDSHMDDMRCALKQYRHCALSFYKVNKKMIEGMTIRKFAKRITLTTYYRCFLSNILPKNVKKALYLDCDILILDNISSFYETELGSYAAAAIEDIGAKEKERYDILKYPLEKSYFNAGVILFNRDYWQETDIPGKCMDFYKAHPERILFNDQDLLNCVLCDSKFFVDLKYNVQDGFYRKKEYARAMPSYGAILTDALKRPCILHFTNKKPWKPDCFHPLRKKYFEFLTCLPENLSKDPRTIGWRIRRTLKLIPYILGLRKRKYINLNEI